MDIWALIVLIAPDDEFTNLNLRLEYETLTVTLWQKFCNVLAYQTSRYLHSGFYFFIFMIHCVKIMLDRNVL